MCPYVKTDWAPGDIISEAKLDNLETQYDEAIAEILTIAETEVFSGNSPAGWTDLDLSATIGAQATLVILKVYVPATEGFGIRKNGDTDAYKYGGTNPAGCAALTTLLNNWYIVLAVTDTSGIVEWITGGVTANTTIDVIGYVKGE